jgi:hypothetical protein
MKIRNGPVWVLVLLMFMVSMASAGVRHWKNPGLNPAKMGYKAIDSLKVSQDKKDRWWQLVNDSSGREVSVPNGTVLSQLSFGELLPGTHFGLWDSTVCDFAKVESIPAKLYEFMILPDSAGVQEAEIWRLFHFDICNNVAWQKSVMVVFRQKESPPDSFVIVEMPEQVFEQLVKECKILEWENFNSVGTYGYTSTGPRDGDTGFGYASTGFRLNAYLCDKHRLALSTKAIMTVGTEYRPHKKDESGRLIDFRQSKLSQNIYLGLRYANDIRTDSLGNSLGICAYFYPGWQRYQYRWQKGVSWNGEVNLSYKRFQWNNVTVSQPKESYLWSRSRLEWMYALIGHGNNHVGIEFFYEGHENLLNPDYYGTRGGVLWGFFHPYDTDKWWSFTAHSGYGHYGWYAGLELNFEGWLIKTQKTVK